VELKIEIDARLLERAQEAGISIEKLAEAELRRALADLDPDLARYRGLSDEQKARLWGDENAEAIEAHKARIAEFGVFGEDFRSW
ncbi:MAG: type II toxin-antitoxin system CcdA family antitoxin, partial [Phenylobacterium sp.]|uniref:type II toxin-antitoxin system CcdA family antitoxin n=1 Tax=Phenylobacterium sp. TaxID=1871053 RepID=UPI001A3C77D7